MLTPRSLICWSLSHNPALDNSTPHVSRDKVYTLIRISTRWPLEGYWIEEWSGHDSLLINKSTESINVRKLFKHQATFLMQNPKAVARGRCTRCTCSTMHFKISCRLKRPQTVVHLQWQFVATALYPYKFSKIFEKILLRPLYLSNILELSFQPLFNDIHSSRLWIPCCNAGGITLIVLVFISIGFHFF